jgi:hypothetical protein
MLRLPLLKPARCCWYTPMSAAEEVGRSWLCL